MKKLYLCILAMGLIGLLSACDNGVNKRGRSSYHGTQPSIQYGEACEFGDPEYYCGIRYGR